MPPPKKPLPHFEVEDPAEAMRKAEDFTRRILAVPKSVIDAKLHHVKPRAAKPSKRR